LDPQFGQWLIVGLAAANAVKDDVDSEIGIAWILYQRKAIPPNPASYWQPIHLAPALLEVMVTVALIFIH
jgi:hypothetical protein